MCEPTISICDYLWHVRADPERVSHYELVAKCSGTEYKKQVSFGPDIKEPHQYLSREAKGLALKVAAKHNISDLKAIEINVFKIDREMLKAPEISKGARGFSK